MNNKYIILYREDGFFIVDSKQKLIEILEEGDNDRIEEIYELGRFVDFKVTAVLID